uniref:Salivary secreted protein n=1 Tax=Bursaphelenchus xylophilus TaxID=6326 RepID=A0A1I7S1A0_BURXY
MRIQLSLIFVILLSLSHVSAQRRTPFARCYGILKVKIRTLLQQEDWETKVNLLTRKMVRLQEQNNYFGGQDCLQQTLRCLNTQRYNPTVLLTEQAIRQCCYNCRQF